jgi:hypothetical protein
MSFADDFWHDVPPDDWPGGSGYPRKYTTRFTGYRSEVIFKRKYNEISHETDKAYLFIFKEGKAWLPKSRIVVDKKTFIIKVPSWLWYRVNFIKN